MDAVVALCHFCEVHGPRILFTCQAHRKPSSTVAGSKKSSLGLGIRPPPIPPDGDRRRRKFYGDYKTFVEWEESRNEDDIEVCVACTSIGDNRPAFLTNDHRNRISFVSSQQPYDQELLGLLRGACLRSLSCEVSPNKEGPIFFGDEQNGYTVSHTFTLRDSKARGFRHWYSLVMVSCERLPLLRAFDSVVCALKSIIQELQKKATEVFEMEQSDSSNDSLRLSAFSRASMLPSGFLRERGGSGATLRPLAELTNDPHVFGDLHRAFVGILSGGPASCEEWVLDGSPREDTLTQLEEVTELQDCRPIFFARDDEMESSGMAADVEDMQILSRLVGKESLRLVIQKTIIGAQIVVRGECEGVRERVLNALRCLLPVGCAKLVSHSSEYLQSWSCNLLGLPLTVSIPGHVLSEGVVVTVAGEAAFGRLAEARVESALGVPTPAPFLLLRYEKLFADCFLTTPVLEEVVQTIKDEWLNKAKLIYQFYRQRPDASPAELARILTVAGVTEADLPVIRFWQAGFSQHYKSFVRKTCARFHRSIEDKDGCPSAALQ